MWRGGGAVIAIAYAHIAHSPRAPSVAAHRAVTFMTHTLRVFAAAAIAGTTAALLCNAVLQLALHAVQPLSYRTASWWGIAEVAERGVWVVAAGLCWLAAPLLGAVLNRESARARVDELSLSRLTRAAALRLVGVAMIALPLAWLVATWLVIAVRLTLASAWSEAQMFASADYYSLVLTTNAAWLLGGAVLIGWSRHAE